MVDRSFNVSVGCVVAYGLWSACLTLWCVSWITHLAPLGQLSLIICGMAVVATIRTYFIGFHERMKTALAVTREAGSVKPIR